MLPSLRRWGALALLAFFACAPASNPPVGESGGAARLARAKGQPLWSRWAPSQPVENFRVLILYFKLADDYFMAQSPEYSDSLRCLVRQWPAEAPEPRWKGELLVERPFHAATVDMALAEKPNSLTAFFYQMSGGRFWLYGDELTYSGPPIRRGKTKREWRRNNLRILRWLARNTDLRKYDNDSDGFVDCILFINRARPQFPYGGAKKGKYQGVANDDFLPPHTVIRDPDDPGEPRIRGARDVRRNSVIYQTNVYALSMRNIILHEFGHRLLGGGHRNGLHRFNLMSGSGPRGPSSNGVVLSAYEKIKLGWLQPIVLRHDTTDFALEDLTASNQALKIPVRRGYFLLEYRRNHPGFEIIPERECPPTAGLPEGLLISRAMRGQEPKLVPADGQVAVVNGHALDGDRSDLFPFGEVQDLTPYTEPNTHLRGHRTGLAICNIRLQGGVARFDVYLNYWQGTLPKKVEWRGEITVGGRIVVPRGARLNIRPGARIRVLPGGEIVVRGTLTALGRAVRPITFFAPQQGWAGLIFDGPGASGSRLQHVILRGGNLIRRGGANPQMIQITQE